MPVFDLRLHTDMCETGSMESGLLDELDKCCKNPHDVVEKSRPVVGVEMESVNLLRHDVICKVVSSPRMTYIYRS